MPAQNVNDSEKAEVICISCGQPKKACKCFVKCRCGENYREGEVCGNPIHKYEHLSKNEARLIVSAVIKKMNEMYPLPMVYASGGFRKALGDTIEREVYVALLAAMTAK